MQNPHIRPLQVHTAGSAIVLHSIPDAVDFLRAQTFAEHAEPLIDVMEAADEPEMERRAWQAFETFTASMRMPVRLAV
ncbi:hypothetical protein EZH22_05970 [Xanthobacter dioxanivorans]|uniref:Uncharacterized protein n=1 Tax=Xanthobacter dioxanivorans TaxID=2528964 RepID=A0A974SJX6_9HYPH|nr:hypothetical protein [Xanthobacter dioxanivorans]QRG07912.1 hypothetical protein EZH22_05970 [Xanthobacter dioxanivorans]